jgi:hypothetical protein
MNLHRRLANLQRCEIFRVPSSVARLGKQAEDLALHTGMGFEAAAHQLLTEVTDAELASMIAEFTPAARGIRRPRPPS